MFDFVDDTVDKIVEKYRSQIRQAFKKAEVVARQRIENNVIPEAVGQYYSEYWPKYYLRQYQLYKSLGPSSNFNESNNVFVLELSVIDDSPFGVSAMSHSSGDGSKYGPGASYCSNKKNVNEGKIFDNFLSGIHPNVPKLKDEFQGTNTVDNLDKLLDDLIETELMPLIDGAID